MNSPNQIDNFNFRPPKRTNLLVPIVALWGIGMTLVFVFLVISGGFGETFGDYYLLPWAVLAGAIVLSPSAYYYYHGTFDLFHPLVYGVWSYIFPAFILGAFIITADMTNTYVLLYVTEPEYNLPLSLFYIVIGFIGVVIGYYLPINKLFVKKLENYLPKPEWTLEDIWVPGLLLVMFGLGINILGVLQGLLGFQRIDQVGMFDSLVGFLTIVFTVGFVMLWLGVFQTPKNKRTGIFYIVLILLIALIPLRQALQGGRSGLMVSVIPIAMAFWYSGRKLKWQHSAVFGVTLFLAISIGIIYGTTFRQIKGSEARIDAGDYVGQVAETLDYLARTDSSYILSEGTKSLAGRLENLSSLGVVVANYEKLEPYEESYGLKNNIVNDLLTSLIPRFVWADKPNTSDPRAYSDLYFDYGDNSFAITPFGDLLRNFGVIGIPLGMMIIGIYLRIIYSYLIDTPEPRIWKKVAYYPLLTVVSYEAFYAIFFPTMIRVTLIVAVSLSIAGIFFRKSKSKTR